MADAQPSREVTTAINTLSESRSGHKDARTRSFIVEILPLANSLAAYFDPSEFNLTFWAAVTVLRPEYHTQWYKSGGTAESSQPGPGLTRADAICIGARICLSFDGIGEESFGPRLRLLSRIGIRPRVA